MGVSADGEQKASFEPGLNFTPSTPFCEGCRGHLGKELIARYRLDEHSDPQHYGIGIKEVWEIPEEKHEEAL